MGYRTYRMGAVVFVHEVGRIAGSLRYVFVFGALALLLALTALPAATRFELEREEHGEVARAFVAALENGTVAGFTDQRVLAIKPPWPLLFAPSFSANAKCGAIFLLHQVVHTGASAVVQEVQGAAPAPATGLGPASGRQ